MERFVKGKHVLFLSMLKTEADNAINHDLAVIFACIFVCMILNLLFVCSFFVPLNALVSVKAGFHMIADRRSQIAIRSAIVCDHMETTSAIVCDPAITIADDRRR